MIRNALLVAAAFAVCAAAGCAHGRFHAAPESRAAIASRDGGPFRSSGFATGDAARTVAALRAFAESLPPDVVIRRADDGVEFADGPARSNVVRWRVVEGDDGPECEVEFADGGEVTGHGEDTDDPTVTLVRRLLEFQGVDVRRWLPPFAVEYHFGGRSLPPATVDAVRARMAEEGFPEHRWSGDQEGGVETYARPGERPSWQVWFGFECATEADPITGEPRHVDYVESLEFRRPSVPFSSEAAAAILRDVLRAVNRDEAPWTYGP
jgi:hypothetical protein